MEDAIYGDDLLGGSPARAEAAEGEPAEAPAEEGPAASLPATQEGLQEALQAWEVTFQEERAEGGAFAELEGRILPETVLAELRRARAEAAALRQRLAASAAEVAAAARDDLTLRRELHAARAAGEPSVLQLRQLLLDPAVNREFARLRTEAAAAQQELQAVRFSMGDTKGPRGMAAKFRALEDRCAALSEGRAAQLERSLALARTQLEDMRRQYGELEDHVHSLDDEAEALKMEILTMRRAGAAGPATGPPGGGGPPGFGPPAGHPDPHHHPHHHSGGPPPGSRGGAPPGWVRGPPPPSFAGGRGPPAHFGGGRGGGMPPPGKRPREY